MDEKVIVNLGFFYFPRLLLLFHLLLSNVKFVLSLHYNGDDSYLFVNGRQE